MTHVKVHKLTMVKAFPVEFALKEVKMLPQS